MTIFHPGHVLAAAEIAVYLLPSLVALSRRAPHRGTVVMVNVLLGWTVVGWFYSLAAAWAERNGQTLGDLRLESLPGLPKVPEPKRQPGLRRAA